MTLHYTMSSSFDYPVWQKKAGLHTHPYFADGMSEAFIGTCLIQCNSIELAFVQVGHRPFTLLLPQRPAGLECVLEGVSVEQCVFQIHHNTQG